MQHFSCFLLKVQRVLVTLRGAQGSFLKYLGDHKVPEIELGLPYAQQ